MTLIYKCPLCETALQAQGRSLLCENKHCFDYAKDGYVNLHPVHEKNSLQPGDSKEMLAARQRFLNAGYYQPLAEEIHQLINQLNGSPCNILDIGCGEGFYLQALKSLLQSKPNSHSPTLSGLDISKEGVRKAAKRKTGAQLSVASAFKLPYFESSFDLVFSVFAPIDLDEVSRVLKPQGHLVAVGPHEQHLRELAEKIYDSAQDHSQSLENLKSHKRFDVIDEKRLTQTTPINNEHRLDLLKMTPYYWQAQSQAGFNLDDLQHITIDFKLLVLQLLNP